MDLKSFREDGSDPQPKVAKQPIYMVLAAVSLLVLGLCIVQLLSRFNYQRGMDAITSGKIDIAEDYVQKADHLSLPLLFKRDLVLRNVSLGNINVLKAEAAKKVSVYAERMEQADRFYRLAIDNDPHNVDAFTGLVRATIGLENVYPYLHKKKFHHEVLPLFEQLRSKMPANLYTFSLLTKYYHRKNMTEELQEIVGESVRHYPPIYFQLLNQPFYSMAMNEMLKTSFQDAIDQDIYTNNALKGLSDIYEREGDLSKAIEFYTQAIPKPSPNKDISSYYVRLGRLYLKNGQIEEARVAFLDSLKTKERENRLRQIWSYYNREKRYPEFIQLMTDAENEYALNDYVRILRALALIESDKYQMAISNLIRIDSPKYLPESYFLQSRIAEKLKDWDTMELRSQRATVLDPTKSKYHYQFSKALYNQKKYTQAEQAVTVAIDVSEKVSAWHLSHRAWARYHQKKYDMAQQDWERAIKISPSTTGFYLNMAYVFEQGDNFETALTYVQKALELKPEDKRGLEVRKRLETKLGAQ
ncbi:tetratricopeptide repeat protein [Desulforhopalus sp. 52FAK]